MGNVIFGMMVSLDGFVADRTGSVRRLYPEGYNGPRNLNTEKGRDKIYSKHDEKTVYSSFQGQSRPGTSQRREDHGANRRRI